MIQINSKTFLELRKKTRDHMQGINTGTNREDMDIEAYTTHFHI